MIIWSFFSCLNHSFSCARSYFAKVSLFDLSYRIFQYLSELPAQNLNCLFITPQQTSKIDSVTRYFWKVSCDSKNSGRENIIVKIKIKNKIQSSFSLANEMIDKRCFLNVKITKKTNKSIKDQPEMIIQNGNKIKVLHSQR